MSDEYLLQISQESQFSEEPFVVKKVLYQSDSNNSSYNGQILLDTSSLSNSGLYQSYNSAYFEIPLIIRLTATSTNAQTTTIQGYKSAFAAGIKAGYWQFLHSMSVELNNTSVVQLVPYLNQYVSYRVMTQFSEDDVEKYGSLLGFFADTNAFSYGSQSTIDANGHGVLNNRNLPQFPADVYDYQTVINSQPNWGLFKRQKYCMALTPSTTPASYFTSESSDGTVGQNYFTLGTSSNNINSKFWFVLATIRLKDISDYFSQLPLSKGLFHRFIINYNQPTHNISIITSGGAVEDISITSNQIVGGSSPLMIANGNDSGNGFYQLANACATIGDGTYTFQLTSSIAKDTTYNVGHPTITNCRLYVPSYQMQPQIEEQYLSLNKVKTVQYKDIMNYTVNVTCSGTPAQGSFSALLTNGLINVKRIIIIPFAGASSNYTGSTASSPVVEYQSPFSSAPGTCCPNIQLTQFNVLVSGVNIFHQSELYNFQQFTDELSSAECLNGGQSTGLVSGLIGYEEFQTGGYNYYTVDLSRRVPGDDKVPKSVQIQGQVLSGTIDNIVLQVFLEYDKEIILETQSGTLLG